ncbi:hypothetical protein Ciccas_000277 [Cichlidogyrus casuarinus]|uniref:Carbohydrate deacetylase n=1 Tax=Cichlidogyrus casuarinus TaxID=1844966 RepID=A0ABD2QNC1_9PLAT
MKLIVVADDGGYSEIRDTGILSALEDSSSGSNRGISEVAILTNGVVSRDLNRTSRSNLFSYLKQYRMTPGLHINLTEGTPLSKRCSLLLNDCGIFRGKFGFRQLLQQDESEELFREIFAEIEAQITQFVVLFGCDPSFINGHQHIHVLPMVVKAICSSSLNGKSIFVRIPHEDSVYLDTFSSTSNMEAISFYQQVGKESEAAKADFVQNGFRVVDVFIGMALMGQNLNVQNLKRDFQALINKGSISTIELMVHPGYPLTEKDTEAGCGSGPDDFSKSSDRDYELNFLKSQQFSDLMQTFGINLQRFSCIE